MVEAAGDALQTTVGLVWKALWALALGYAVSSAIQIFVPRAAAARRLGDGTPPQLGLAMLLGFASSSCSFAALAATRSLWAKGAALTSALAFMFASTNLAVEVAALAFIFLGWQYALALFVGAPILVSVMAVLVRLTFPRRLSEQAQQHAREAEADAMDHTEGLPEGFGDRVRDARAWRRIGSAYRAEWRMVWKELLVGFTIAGAIAALVPASFFEALFPTEGAAWWLVPLQAALAPVLAVMTFIGSMGNGPLAAVLANNGVLFGGIMTFLYADFIVPPALKINAKYYGWRFSLYLAAVFSVVAVVTGVAVHALFSAIGLLPDEVRDVSDVTTFAFDYTFWLNAVAVVVAATLFLLARRNDTERAASGAR